MEFFKTAMGHRYFESTLPTIARELKRLNDNLERLCHCVERPGSEVSHSQQGERDEYEGE